MPHFVDSSPPGECIFCRIAQGSLPAARVYEDDTVLAFMDLGQLNPGHVLVAPKRHARDLFEIPTADAQAVMAVAQRIAVAAREAFQCPGLTLLQANGKEGGQTVFHFHMHVLPRHADDGVDLVWPRKDPALPVLQEYAAAITARLASARH